jgi:rusticyanin
VSRRLVVLITAAALAVGGVAVGVTLILRGSSTPTPATADTSYAYYQSVMSRYSGGTMMGGSSSGWMMGQSGYTWTMGGANAPGWMNGGSLPNTMMGEGSDPGTIMGSIFANAPGPRLSDGDATKLGDSVPLGAVADASAHRLTFSGKDVSFTVLASPSMPQESFEVAGMADPTIVVPQGAQVTIQFVNADTDMAHGFVVTANTAASSSSMPMMAATPAFSGAALWFLGDATSAGMHTATLSFTTTTAGTYQYLCPVPGHAEEGMAGSFVVVAGS